MAEAALVEDGDGYDVEFIDENVPKDKITCSVCLYTLREPMQANPCGHRFCKTCIEKVEQQQQEYGQKGLNCPNDRMQVQVFPDIGKKREILDLHVKCTNITNKCDWKGELRYYENHLEKCLFQPLMCTKNCGKGRILRKEMKHHLEYDCPNNMQECKYSVIGCTFKGTLNVIDQHLKENQDEHIFRQITNQIHQVDDLKKKLLQSRNASEAEISILNHKIEHLEAKDRQQDQNFRQLETNQIHQINDLKTKLLQSRNASEAEISILNHKIEHLEAKDRQKDQKIRQLERKTQDQDEVIAQYKQSKADINVLNQKIQHLEGKTLDQDEIIAQYKHDNIDLQNNFSELGNLFQLCPYTFTVKNVPEYFKDGDVTNYMHSEGFYFLNGYKGKLKISFNHGSFNDEVYIGLMIIKGPFDDYL